MSKKASATKAKKPVGSTQPPTEVKQLLRVPEVAKILGVSETKVYAHLKRGLPSVKIDGARRVHPDKLQAWIELHSA